MTISTPAKLLRKPRRVDRPQNKRGSILKKNELTRCFTFALLLTAVGAGPNLGSAAVPSRLSSPANLNSPKTEANPAVIKKTLAALELDVPARMKALLELGPEGYRSLRAIMFDPLSKIEMRWRATMAVGRLGGRLSLPELERAKNAEVWELRSAALLSLARFDREKALVWSRELLKDKALLVRLSAVQTIGTFQDRESIPYLWAQLESQTNFRHGKGLFIRRKIAETLASLEGKGSEAKFVALLGDRDSDIHQPAVEALERITGQNVGRPEDKLTRRRALWQNWWISKSSGVSSQATPSKTL